MSPKPRAILFSHESSIDKVLRKPPNGRNLIRKVDMEQITSHQFISTVVPVNLEKDNLWEEIYMLPKALD